MTGVDQLHHKQVVLELSGKHLIKGILVDYGLDVVVIYNGNDFLYIPIMQIQNMKENPYPDPQLYYPTNLPFETNKEGISLRKMITNAKGMFVKLYVVGNQTLHGYVINVLNDYFVFYSPVYKNIFVSIYHLKWLIPYTQNTTPYSLKSQQIAFNPSSVSVSRSFEEQLKRLEGNIVVFDIGDNPAKSGLLKKVSDKMIILVTGEGEEISWNVQHLKTVHTP
ncbi:UNVERIFIED_CONTAM: hypothetical protein ABID98_004109 [Brevibacillus sp. OAP136]